jgi:predicted permease
MTWWRRREQELDEELEAHFRLAIADRIARGESPVQAAAAARREFGNVTLIKEVTRAQWSWAWLERLLQDLPLALRTLRRTPRFTVAAVLCIAVGTGATTTIFSALHGILLRPLPYPNADALVVLRARNPGMGPQSAEITEEEITTWRRARTLSAVGVWRTEVFDFTGPEDAPERVTGALVSANLFSLLGTRPLHGRWFEPSEEHQGSSDVVLLGHDVWQRRYGGDAGLVGRTIPLFGKPFRVVGIMPRGFSFPEGANVWIPLLPLEWGPDILYYSGVIGKLGSGNTLGQVQAEVAGLMRELTTRSNTYNKWIFDAVTLREHLVGPLRRPILIFQVAALMVWLIACGNVAALMLARGAARGRELAVRAAIGAGRSRLVAHVLVECFALSLLGGIAGLGVAALGVKLLTFAFPDGVPSYIDLSIRAPELAVTLAITLVAASAFGIAPGLRAGRTRSAVALSSSARTQGSVGGSFERSRARDLLVGVEIAASVVLVVGAVLLMRSHTRLQQSLGFDDDGVISVRVRLPSQKYDTDEKQAAFYGMLQDQFGALPGVESVSAAVGPVPLDGTIGGKWYFRTEDQAPAAAAGQFTMVHAIAPGYMHSLHIPIMHGRDVALSDRSPAEHVALVNQTFASRYFAGADAVGRRVIPDLGKGSTATPIRIVGVVRDFRHERPPAELMPAIYVLRAMTFPAETFVLRTRLSDASSLAPSIRALMRELDPTLVADRLQTQTHVVERAFWRERLQGNVVGIFAAVALLLALFGMYGVLSYAVAQRTPELGIRLAVGASSNQLLGLVLAQGARVALIGIVAGVVAALALSRVLTGLLYDVRPADPVTFVVVAIALLIVALLAALLPALRAARLDPLTAIRWN